MIQRVTDQSQLFKLPLKGIEPQKIRALFYAYGMQYDFCRFYEQDDACFVALFGGSAVIGGDSVNYRELADFLVFSGVVDIFCSVTAGEALQKCLAMKREIVNLMRFCGTALPAEVNSGPALSEVYEIISKSFDIEFESWYLDMSHRVRHGVAKCFTIENSAACVLQHDINGEALISQVATLVESRGNGYARRLIHEVCRRCKGSEVYVICEDMLLDFYEKLGFVKCGECVVFSAE